MHNNIFLLKINFLDSPADPEHPAYHLSGPKNLVEYTTRDHENGWQVNGAGAGIEVTASGVIADLVKAAKHT